VLLSIAGALSSPSWSVGAAADPRSVWKPDAAEIRQLEQALKLPSAATSIDHYSRYYTGIVDRGKLVIVGTLVSGLDKITIVDSLNDLPGILDGGCSVVNVEFDVQSRRFIKVYCNGVA
jgi:hypothetical protein